MKLKTKILSSVLFVGFMAWQLSKVKVGTCSPDREQLLLARSRA